LGPLAAGGVDEVEAIVQKNVRRLSEDFEDFESKEKFEKLPNHRSDKRQRSFSPFKKGPSSIVPQAPLSG